MKTAATLERPTLPHHARRGDAATVLAEILNPAVTLAIWRRSSPLAAPDLDAFENVRLTTHLDVARSALTAALSTSPAIPWIAALIDDAALLADRFASIMNVDTVEIRIDRIVGDACRRFHADYVSARLLCTYVGCGTQWLDQATAVRLAGDADAAVRPRTLLAGEVGIMKGRDLAGEVALVHRSPPIAGRGEERLLLVIDPAV